MPSFANTLNYSFFLNSYDPLVALQPKLAHMWDAERSSTITRDGAGLVSEWRGAVAGTPMAQLTVAKQPVYSATSFGGRPGVTFDGVDDELTYTFPGTHRFPLGAAPCEMWVVGNSGSIDTDATTRTFFGYGNNAGTRNIQRTTSTGLNTRFRCNVVGAGTSNVTLTLDQGVNKRFLGRGVNNGTTTIVQTNNKGDSTGNYLSSPMIPATVTGQARIGAGASATAAGFILGTISFIALFDSLLTIDESDALAVYLQPRYLGD